MECFCGCKRRIPKRLADVNIRLGETALDLLAWDRCRTLGELDSVDLSETDQLVIDGADCHRRLLAVAHGADDNDALAAADSWLGQSRARWATRPTMVERGSFLGRRKLRLTEDDFARLDRVHPERSFSRTPRASAARIDDDVVDQLERLGAMREKGLLTAEEFQSAKSRLLG
jgi:hypothetical protein